jgi:glycosyltransferase involved in cell wall biosynthesis
VLFCARLHRRKRPLHFVRTAERLLAEGVDASFVLVGPDEGEGAAVAAAVARTGDPDRLRWEGPLPPSRTLARMQRASLLVLPSVDEPYPMSVLEALSVGRPVVVTDSCGLAPAVRETGCGVVVDSSEPALLDAVRTLLRDPTALAARAARCLPAVRERFGMDAVADVLEDVYASAAGAGSA